MKKALSILLALALMLGAVCTASAADTPVTLTVMIYERGNTTNTYGTVTDNFYTRWVQEKFGDPNGIKVEYIPVPRAQEAEKVNTMMASGSAPDIIISYDTNMIMNFGKDGGLVELSGLVDEYGPNLKKNLAETLNYGTYDGKMWALVAKRTNVGRYANYIRTDWLEKMGYTLQTNEDGFYHMSVEDFTDLLRKAKTLDLDGTGMEIYPLGMAGAYDATQTRPLVYTFVNRAEMTDEMRACYNEMFWPGYKEGVRFLNQLYNEGLVDPDFMVDTDTAYPALTAQISNGRTLAFGHDNTYQTGIKALYESNPEANFTMFLLDNVHGEQFVDVYAPVGMYIAVPATCKNPEAAVKYLDFLADYENAKVLHYGIEGRDYEMIDGVPTKIEYTEAERLEIDGYERITCGDMMLVYNGQPYGYPTSLAGMTEVEARIQQLMDLGIEIAKVGGSAPYHFSHIRTEADEQYEGFLTDPTKNLPSLISCPADQFDAMYEKVLNDYLSAGGQAVIDAKVALYQELEAAKQK